MKELIYKDQRINYVGTTSNNWYWFHLELWLFVPPIFRIHKAAPPLNEFTHFTLHPKVLSRFKLIFWKEMVLYYLRLGNLFRSAGGYILPDFPDVRPELPEFPALEGSLCATLLVHKVEALGYPTTGSFGGCLPFEQWKEGPWLFRVFVCHYTTQFFRDCNKPL